MKSDDILKEHISLERLMYKLDMSRSWIKQRIDEGDFKAVRFGHKVQIELVEQMRVALKNIFNAVGRANGRVLIIDITQE